tara:strand:- start:353 stop:676 length:324 start_codon:yes stop_codon:yes gene_type:complete
MNEVSINFGGLIMVGVTLTFWGSVLLYIHYKHKRNIKRINKKIEERVNRQLDEHDRMTMEEQVNQYWQTVRRSAMMPNEGYMPSAMFKTDKLSPKKKKITHKMDMTK